MSYAQLRAHRPDPWRRWRVGSSALDVLVNNAGANFLAARRILAPDGFDASVALNLDGPTGSIVALWRALKASTAAGGASVVNLASMSALRRCRWCPEQCGKAPESSRVTRLLAVKWAKDGIRGQRGGARCDRHPDDRAPCTRCPPSSTPRWPRRSAPADLEGSTRSPRAIAFLCTGALLPHQRSGVRGGRGLTVFEMTAGNLRPTYPDGRKRESR